MKATVTLLGFALLIVVHVYAQRFPTNNISQEQAIKIASHLWAGMSPAEVEKAVDKKNGLKPGRTSEVRLLDGYASMCFPMIAVWI